VQQAYVSATPRARGQQRVTSEGTAEKRDAG
jgi:hypothetical protein